MNGYVRDVLLGVSLIGPPIIFGTLLYYGLTLKERHHHHESETHDQARALKPAPPTDRNPDTTVKSA